MNNCVYYQAVVTRSHCWYVVAILRSFEHMAFDRTLDVSKSLFEFFVPPAMEPAFCALMNHFEQHGLVTSVQKLTNRLEQNEPVWPNLESNSPNPDA